MSRSQIIWIVASGLVLLGCLCLSVYPLLALHPWAQSFLVLLGVQLLLFPVLAVIFFGKRWGLWDDSRDRKRAEERDITVTANAILGFISFGLAAICLFAFSSVSPFSWSISFRTTGLGFLYASAFFAAGALLGFLFGIPRSVAPESEKKDKSAALGTPESKPGDNRRARYTTNTNLEEISDWLTKIIVGLGLINLKAAPEQLKKAAWFFANFCGKDYCESVALALIIYFSVCGFFLGYLMTRLYLTGAFTRADEAARGGIVEPWRPGLPPGLTTKEETRSGLEPSGQTQVDLGIFGPNSIDEV